MPFSYVELSPVLWKEGRRTSREAGGQWDHGEFSDRCGRHSLGTSTQNCCTHPVTDLRWLQRCLFFLIFKVKLFERLRLRVENSCIRMAHWYPGQENRTVVSKMWTCYVKIARHADIVGLALNLHWRLFEVLLSWFRSGRCNGRGIWERVSLQKRVKVPFPGFKDPSTCFQIASVLAISIYFLPYCEYLPRIPFGE